MSVFMRLKRFIDSSTSPDFNEELAKITEAYSRFCDSYISKQAALRDFKAQWQQSGKSDILSTIKSLNDKIMKDHALISEGLDEDHILTLISKGAGTVNREEFRKRASTLSAIMKSLMESIHEENRYLSEFGDWAAFNDLDKHGPFHVLLYNESRIIDNLKQQFMLIIGFLKRYETKDIEKNLNRIRFFFCAADTKDMFNFYHGVYLSRFPNPLENISYELMNSELRKGAYRLIIAKIDDEVVGGTVYRYPILEDEMRNPDGTLRKVRYMIGFGAYICVVKGARERGITLLGTKLIAARNDDLRRLAATLNMEMRYMLIEVDEPSKMTEEQKKSLSGMRPEDRVALFRRAGFRKVFHDYISILPSDKGLLFATFGALYLLPLTEQVNNGISKAELMRVLRWLCIDVWGHNPDYIMQTDAWKYMMVKMAGKEFFTLE